jgi:cell division septum initiation protein DivIVA
MNHDDSQEREHEVRERIANLIRAAESARTAPVTGEELQKLKAAASRLDEMLKAAAEADSQALRGAAERLDQMLADIGKGRNVSQDLKRRDGNQRR